MILQKVTGEKATYRDVSKRSIKWLVFFSLVSACIRVPYCVINPGNSIHVRTVTECISWTFTEQQEKHHTWKLRNGVVPTCKCNSPTMTLQIRRTRTFSTAIARVAAENALSRGSGSTLTGLLQVMKLPASQWDKFLRLTPLDYLVLAATVYEDCPERFDFLQNKGQSWSFVWVMKQLFDHRNVLEGKENNDINFLTPGRNNSQLLAQHKLLNKPDKLPGRKQH